MTDEPRTISRTASLALAFAGACVGVGITFACALAMGGSSRTASIACLAVAAASLVGLAPGLLRVHAESWGLLVFGASIARLMLVVLIAFVLDNSLELDRRPFWMSIVAGAVFILIAETTTAIRAIARFDAHRSSTPAGATLAARSPHAPERSKA